ncbi:MAG: NUDIX hydrolase [Thalassovita sp.]
MTELLTTLWGNIVEPLFQRPKKLQVAALCHRGHGDDVEILLITSRDTGRWIIPKGWPIRGMELSQAALQEAWEEAGVHNSVALSDPIGIYGYDKRLNPEFAVPVETHVFAIQVSELADDYPEVDQRKRMWIAPSKAADLVDEDELKQLLRDFSVNTVRVNAHG